MDEFSLQPQISGEQGWHFSMLAGNLSEILQWWESNISVLGDYVGTDTNGQKFKAAYQQQLDSIEPAMRAIVQRLYDLGSTLDRLTQAAEDIDATDARTIRSRH